MSPVSFYVLLSVIAFMKNCSRFSFRLFSGQYSHEYIDMFFYLISRIKYDPAEKKAADYTGSKGSRDMFLRLQQIYIRLRKNRRGTLKNCGLRLFSGKMAGSGRIHFGE